MAKIKKITSLQHPLVKHLVRLRKQRRYRHVQGSVLIEGEKLVKEVCNAVPAKTLMITDERPRPLLAEEVFLVSEAVMKKISGVRSPEGTVAEVVMPDIGPAPEWADGKRKILVLDGVSDPGNLGALLRSALALGWEGAFITESSCDPFNDKALRAAKGATFRLPFVVGSWEHLDKILAEGKLEGVVADIQGEDAEKFVGKEKIALILGNESQGASQQARHRFDRVRIPMPGPMESLNVAIAGAILMYVI